MNSIDQAKDEGFSPDEILTYVIQTQPHMKDKIHQALNTGFSPDEVLTYINTLGSNVFKKGIRNGEPLPQQERGVFAAAKRGFKSGVTGLVAGASEQVAPADEGFFEGLASLAGELTSDVPAMIAGSAAGGIAGAAAGTVIPGAGTTIGGVLGAGAGAFSLPSMIKQTFAEYRDFTKGGGEGTFGEFLDRAIRIGKTGAKSAALGALVSQASKLLPVLKRMPKFAKLLNTRIGKAIEQPTAELATLTAGQAALEGKIPTLDDIIKNTFAITGFRLTKGAAKKAIKKGRDFVPFDTAAKFSSKRNLNEMKESLAKESFDKAKETNTPFEYGKKLINPINRKIAKLQNEGKNESEIAEKLDLPLDEVTERIQNMLDAKYDDFVTNGETDLESEGLPEETQDKLDTIENEISKRETSQAKRSKAITEIKESANDLISKSIKLLPEKAQTKIENLSKSIGDFKEKIQTQKELEASRAQRNDFLNIMREEYGKKEADLFVTSLKIYEKLEAPYSKNSGRKDLYFTKQHLEDMIYYRQGTKNPNVKGDTFEKLEKRLPKEAKELTDTFIDDFFDNWREVINSNPYTDDIGFHENYLPGIYTRESLAKAGIFTEKPIPQFPELAKPLEKYKKTIGTKNPFANKKVFKNYLEALNKMELKPRYNNIKELMEHYNNVMLKIEANTNIIESLEKWKQDGGESVHLNKGDAGYDQAKKDGWVEFDDRFLRSEITIDKEAKTSSRTLHEEPALVNPKYAKLIGGTFGKNAFKPENKFWKKYDAINQFLKIAHVSYSPFHVISLAESGFGAMGMDFFKAIKPLRRLYTDNWWDKASDGLNNLDQMKARTKAGLKINRANASAVEHGSKLIKKAVDALGKLGKAGKIVGKPIEALSKAQDWMFQQYLPRLKVATYDRYLETVLERKANQGVEITEKLRKDVARDVAEVVNNQFGGQNYTEMTTLGMNTPEGRKWVQRLVAYPDWCAIEDTRAMTKDGFKYHHELKIGDEIMAFDPISKCNKWSPLVDLYVNPNYDGKMVSIKNYNRAIVVTPNHTCLVTHDKSRESKIVKAEDLNTHHLIPRCAPFQNTTEEAIDDSLVKLVGWIVTDGHILKIKRERKSGTVYKSYEGKITQSKPKTVKLLKDMGLTYYLDKENYDHDKFKSNHPKHIFHVPLERVLRMQIEGVDIDSKSLTWEFLSKLSKRQLQLLYDTMMLGDGTGQNRFCGQEKPVFYMTLIQILLGKSTTFLHEQENCWRTRIIESEYISSCTKSTVDYKGTVWCPTVDTGFWLAERKGLLFITGNSISALKQAKGAFKGGVQGELSREFWVRYALGWAGSTYLMRFIYGGFSRNKDELAWDPRKAVKALKQTDPKALTGFPMPDIDLSIAGIKFNPGRDDKDRKLYSHFGKQALEVPRYLFEPVDALFSKSAPMIQVATKNLLGGTPYKGKLFPARGKFENGRFKPWDATKPFTKKRIASRAKEAISEVLPFGVRGLPGIDPFTTQSKNFSTYLALGAGSIPVRKALSLYASEPFITHAIATKNPRKLKQIIDRLVDNGYNSGQVRGRIKQIRNELQKPDRRDELVRYIRRERKKK